jgi:hypothetical protein
MAERELSRGYRDRITQSNGGGITITPGPTDTPEHTRHFLAVPPGHEITEEESLEMGRALFDAIASEQTEVARKKKK